MRWVRFAALAVLLTAVTVRDPAGLAPAGLNPQWLLLLALLAGLTASPGWAATLAWFAGLLVDLFSLEPLGLHAFCYAVAALVLARLRRSLYSEHPMTQGTLGFVLALLVGLTLLVRLEIAEPVFRFGAQLPQVLLASVITAALLPALVRLERSCGLLRVFEEPEHRV